jgi:hypothetical protein
MIKVVKPLTIPPILLNQGQAENTRNCRSYDRSSARYISGARPFDIQPAIYGHQSVKSILKVAQHQKCCFCEKSQADEYGAVDHYRPKNGYKSKREDELKKPGYYWLGYNWDNLYLICNVCNGASYKSNLFPLVKEKRRAKSHRQNINREEPLLLDPGGTKNPQKHIVFDKAFPRAKTKFGKATINICGLDRAALIEERKKLITAIDGWIYVLDNKANNTPQKNTEAVQFLRDVQKPDAEFSATAIDYIKRFNIQGL